MSQKRTADRRSETVENGLPRAQSALPGRGGLARISAAFWNSLGGLQEGLSTESAIKQEAAIACLLLPFSFFIARDLWTWVALVGSLLFVLSIEFLNTAIERLCNHIQPDRHEAIRITKDLASAGVFFALALAALVWIAALLARFGY
ncbi:MAG TPA: diacylglycerol kinase [Methyloceanibacter sp.]|jgi:diacylglycerol kinase (ATP)